MNEKKEFGYWASIQMYNARLKTDVKFSYFFPGKHKMHFRISREECTIISLSDANIWQWKLALPFIVSIYHAA